MAGNPNHPKKGSIVRAEPIRSREDRERIEAALARRPRDRALFVTGTNTALRAVDLTRLTVGQVRGLRPGEELLVREKKTGKVRRIIVNGKVCAALTEWLAVHPWAVDDDTAALFPNLRTGRPLTVPTLSKWVKRWCRQAGLVGNYASHSLRKSFGYSQRVDHGVGLAVLMKVYGHSTERQTLTYLCIGDNEVRATFMQEV